MERASLALEMVVGTICAVEVFGGSDMPDPEMLQPQQDTQMSQPTSVGSSMAAPYDL